MGNMPDYKLNRKVCTHDHSGDLDVRQLAALPESQSGPGRHKCAACAFVLGVREGIAAERRRQESAKRGVTTEDVDRELDAVNKVLRRLLAHQGSAH